MPATVLVVDDVPANIKLLEAKLISEYYTVIKASSGQEALDILKNTKIDIVLLDVMMPGMDGFETCKKIKANPETIHIPIIMVTALSGIDDRVKGLESGADEFLTKPIKEAPLLTRVKSLSRMKTIIDELKLRNKTNEELGGDIIELTENFDNCKILLIDDDVIQAKNVKNVLVELSNNVKIITSSKELDNLGSFLPDLIIISCQIEDADPLRIGVDIRAKANFKNVSLMMLTDEEKLPIAIKGVDLGVNDYFVYPVDKSELLARTKTQLRKKIYQDNLRNELEESVDLSLKDGLTGVFNRRYFDTHIEKIIEKTKESSKSICLMLFDLDHFKQINDTYGHQAGDEVLKKIAEKLKSSFRVTDLVARYGGEEFIIVLNNITIKNCTNMAEKIKTDISNLKITIPEKDTPISVTTSIGITEYSKEEGSASFISRTDKALYKAKETGRNKVVIG
ncbi:MAG: PleD family two-component system response regulator [Rickettsiaceae bacterium]|nr:PleD family two-component system response regulator [Rickettsiaceae bacterium]